MKGLGFCFFFFNENLIQIGNFNLRLINIHSNCKTKNIWNLNGTSVTITVKIFGMSLPSPDFGEKLCYSPYHKYGTFAILYGY